VGWEDSWFLPALEDAVAKYQTIESTGDVVLLQSEQVPVGRFVDPKMGWSNFVNGHLLHYRIPGWHQRMFDDEGAVALITEHLRPLLDQVDVVAGPVGAFSQGESGEGFKRR
jgi:thioesterase domain-containing protein